VASRKRRPRSDPGQWPEGNPYEFDEALEHFFRRKIATRAQVDAMRAEARETAWWISGIAQLGVIADAHRSIYDAILNGTPYEDWRKGFDARLTEAWGQARPAQAETVFVNACQQSYHAGRREQMQAEPIRTLRPYWAFDAVEDSRTTEICRACDNTVLPADDPWWQTHHPQLHHRCRSRIVPMRRSQAERKGVTTEPPAPEVPEGWGHEPRLADKPLPRATKATRAKDEFLRKQEAEKERRRQRELNKLAERQRLSAQIPQGRDARIEWERTIGKHGDPPIALHRRHELTADLLSDDPYKQADARSVIRAQIKQAIPHVGDSFDWERSPMGAAPWYNAVEGDLLDSGFLACHDWKGIVSISRGQLHGAGQDLARIAAKERPKDFLGTVLHEEMHGFSRLYQIHYHDTAVRMLEEASTELCAARVLAYMEQPGVAITIDLRERVASYSRYIEPLVREISEELGISKRHAAMMITNAHSRGMCNGGYSKSPADYRERWVAHFSNDPKVRDRLQRRIDKLAQGEASS